jgi:hypothetical protein
MKAKIPHNSTPKPKDNELAEMFERDIRSLLLKMISDHK